MPIAAIEHIDVDDKGVARVAGTRIKVIHIVMDKMANGWGPEEIQAQHPHLSLAQVYAAFAYYYDHQAEVDKQIDEDYRIAEEMRAQAGESPLVKKLRAWASCRERLVLHDEFANQVQSGDFLPARQPPNSRGNDYGSPRSSNRRSISFSCYDLGCFLLVIRSFGVGGLLPVSKQLHAEPNKPASGAATRSTADWPLFRGNPLQTGVATDALPDKLDILWKFEAKDAIEGTAAIAKGVVYVGSYDENLYALDLATGKEKWRFKAGPIKAPVSVKDGAVYIGNLDGDFHCIDAATGQKRWTAKTDGEISSGANFAGDNILFGSGDEHLYCLDKNGKEVWKYKVPGGPVLGSPAVAGDRTFAAGCDSTLHILDTAQGKEQGRLDIGGQVGATVAVVGEQLYVGTMSSNEVLAVDWKKPAIVWKFQAKVPNAFSASVAATDSLIVAGSKDRRVYAIDRKTGKGVWSFPTEKQIIGSPVVVGQRVFAGSQDNNLYVLDLAKGTQLQKFDLGSSISASPAVGGGRLVIGTEKGIVYCLGAKP